MAKEKKSKKRSYLNDYRKDVSGKYVYSGNYCKYYGETGYRRVIFSLLALVLASFALAVVGGCTYKGLNNSFYCILPYVVLLGSLGFTAYAELKMAFAGDCIKEYVWRASYKKLALRLNFVLVSSVLCFASGIAFACLNAEFGFTDLLYELLCVGAFALALASKKLVCAMKWQTVPTENAIGVIENENVRN